MIALAGSRSTVIAFARPGLREPDSATGRTEFRCACGYGISINGSLPACPMCQAKVCEQIGSQPFARSHRANLEQPGEKLITRTRRSPRRPPR